MDGIIQLILGVLSHGNSGGRDTAVGRGRCYGDRPERAVFIRGTQI